MSMNSKAVSGVLWTMIEKIGLYVIQLIISIVIARIIGPNNYGLIGMLAIFVALSNTLLDSGFANALIHKRDRTNVDYSTAFYFNVVVGIVLYLSLLLCSSLIADFYNEPQLRVISQVYFLSFLINSLSIVPIAKMTIEMKFKEQSIISIVVQLLTGCVGVLMALSGYGVWALVAQSLGGGMMRMIMLYVYSKWWPMLCFSLVSFKELFNYGSKLLCSSLINTVYNNLYAVVIGRRFSAIEVGNYDKSNQFASLPSTILTSVIMKVLFPLMSEVQDDDEELRNMYAKFIRIPLFFLYPVLVLLSVLSYPLVVLLLKDAWIDAVPILQVLCFVFVFDPLTQINLNILYVKGRTDLVLKLEFIKKPIGLLILFMTMPFGIIAMCFGRIVYSAIAYGINSYFCGSMIGLNIISQFRMWVPILCRAIVSGVVCWFVCCFIDRAILQIVFGGACGVITYILLAIITKDTSLKDLLNIINHKTRSKVSLF